MSTDVRNEVVLDTNVLVSAALNDGNPYRILRLAEDGTIVSITSPDIVRELEGVLLRDRLPFTNDEVDRLVSKVLSLSRVVEPPFAVDVIDDDPDDDKILACAMAGDADVIVSGDSHLLQLEAYEGIVIYSPAAFLDRCDS